MPLDVRDRLHVAAATGMDVLVCSEVAAMLVRLLDEERARVIEAAALESEGSRDGVLLRAGR